MSEDGKKLTLHGLVVVVAAVIGSLGGSGLTVSFSEKKEEEGKVTKTWLTTALELSEKSIEVDIKSIEQRVKFVEEKLKDETFKKSIQDQVDEIDRRLKRIES